MKSTVLGLSHPQFVYAKAFLRLCLLAIFVFTTISFSFTVTWPSVISVICFAASYLLLKTEKKEKDERWSGELDFSHNPYKGKIGRGLIDSESENDFDLALKDFCLYDASAAKSLKNFTAVQNQSECIFAKKARLWGSPDYQEHISLEENIQSMYPVFLRFVCCFESIGLDAFVLELPGHLYGKNIEVFGAAVRRALLTLKNCDNRRKWRKMKRISPASSTSVNDDDPNFYKENPVSWGSKSWVFEIYRKTFFITSFAPFYPESNSRYNFDLPDCYILFQPEISFAIHDLPPDTPVTNWCHPVTVRDKIRIAFHKAGREFIAPMVNKQPLVYDIVKSVEPEDEPCLWWKEALNRTDESEERQ